MKYKKWSLEQKLEILSSSSSSSSSSEANGVVNTCRKYGVSTGTFYSWKKKHENHGEAGLKVSYDTKSKEHKQADGENRVLRKLLSDREIELEVQRELLKKNWNVRSKKDLEDMIYTKYTISKTKIINMVEWFTVVIIVYLLLVIKEINLVS